MLPTRQTILGIKPIDSFKMLNAEKLLALVVVVEVVLSAHLVTDLARVTLFSLEPRAGLPFLRLPFIHSAILLKEWSFISDVHIEMAVVLAHW